MSHDHLPGSGKAPHHKDEGSLKDLFLSAVVPTRRKALIFLGASAMSTSALAAAAPSQTSSPVVKTPGTCTALPEETEGPFPGDGSNGFGSVINILNQSGVMRSDIRTSIGAYAGTAPGVPLTLTLRLVNTQSGCAPLAGYAIYIWHCTRDGDYSLYTLPTENYLRGVQVADANGLVTFTTIIPGCYPGRMPHIHIEVYAKASDAVSYAKKIKTTQLGFDPVFATALYAAAPGYDASRGNLADISFATDNVFSDDTPAELAASTLTPTGSLTSGYTAAIDVGIAV
jgi:protocatechuate 3,4-dioxygenase beta subunit